MNQDQLSAWFAANQKLLEDDYIAEFEPGKQLFVKPEGKLLVAEYRSRKDNQPKPWIDEILAEWNLKVDDCQHNYELVIIWSNPFSPCNLQEQPYPNDNYLRRLI